MINLSADTTIAATLAIVFSTGFLSGLSPCALPTVVFITAYVSGEKVNSKKRGFILSLVFVLGIAFMLSLLGVFAGFIGKIIANEQILNYIIAAILLIMGLWLLKVFKFNPNYNFSKISPKKGSGILGAFLLGIPFGIAASPDDFNNVLWGSEIAAATAPLKAGESGTTTFTAGAPGAYYYICTVPGHASLGMQGSFIVE